MTALCLGKPLDWWTTGDPGNRLAATICRRCEGCPDNDPNPHGVIRRGVAYSDAGQIVPNCESCGAPAHGYRGGTARCGQCAEPSLPLIRVTASRARWLVAMHERGIPDSALADMTGLAASSVGRIRRECARQADPTAAVSLSFLTTSPAIERRAA